MKNNVTSVIKRVRATAVIDPNWTGKAIAIPATLNLASVAIRSYANRSPPDGLSKSGFPHDASRKQYRFLTQSLCLIGKSLFKGPDWVETLSLSHAPLLKMPAPF